MADKCVFDNGATCSALNKKECDRCAFYKTDDEREASMKSAFERIHGLDRDRREYLLRTYHPVHGKKRMRAEA